MIKADIKAYVATKMVLLAFNWEDGKDKLNFIGFAIKRSPGFGGNAESWLPNRLTFKQTTPGIDYPSNTSPIQKFMWWDNRVDDRTVTYIYTVYPVLGDEQQQQLQNGAANTVSVTLKPDILNGIGTWFNRAVVSSQAFTKAFPKITPSNTIKALEWLSDGLEKVIPEFIKGANAIEGCIYHLEDKNWVIPAFEKFTNSFSMVYDDVKSTDTTNDDAITLLGTKLNVQMLPRKNTSIMHNKFLIKITGNRATELLMGSANFTTGGLTQQANYLHTFASPELAEIYLERKRILEDDPKQKMLAPLAAWSKPVAIGTVKIRSFFSPEPKDLRMAIDTIIAEIKKAKRSVMFSLFATTDEPLRNAIFKAADERGLMMFGLINQIPRKKVEDDLDAEKAPDAMTKMRTDIYHRSKENKDVFGHGNYTKNSGPSGFYWESATLGKNAHPAFIHHKFIIIDSETESPVIYTGSANMSNNSQHNNDENLLEIKDAPDLGEIYLCEFLRLYEHYRARAQWEKFKKQTHHTGYTLSPNNTWAKDDFKEGSLKYKSRLNMVKP